LQSQQNQETKTLLDSLVKENEAKIADLKHKHLDDLKNQSVAQKAAIASLKSSLENSKALELEVQEQANNKKLGKLNCFFCLIECFYKLKFERLPQGINQI